MTPEEYPRRPVSALQSAVLERLAHNRQTVVSLYGDDRKWLGELTPDPADLLMRMADNQALYRLQRGRYAVAPRGTSDPEQAVTFQLALHTALADRTAYYLGFHSALSEHRLTDVESQDAYVAVPQDSAVRRPHLEVLGRRVRITRITRNRWMGLERVRVARREFYWRSDLERSLADTMYRTRLCGSMEVVVLAWARGSRQDEFQVSRLCRYASSLGRATSRRCGFMLSLLGRDDEARELHPPTRPTGEVLLDATRSFGERDWPRSSDWGVTVNVPARALDGWLASTS